VASYEAVFVEKAGETMGYNAIILLVVTLQFTARA
jgi:hypothetical protein